MPYRINSMPSIARYYRFALPVTGGLMLLYASYNFPHYGVNWRQWLQLLKLLGITLAMFSLNYALRYGHNPVRAYLTRLSSRQNQSVRVLINILFGMSIALLSDMLYTVVVGLPLGRFGQQLEAALLHSPLLIYIVLMHALFELNEHRQYIALQNEVLKRDQSVARFEALKQQVSPHFLFNSFATLNWLIRENPAAAECFVQKMAQVYRYVLHQGEQPSVTLREELAFVESYVYLLHTRFEHSLQVEIDIPAALFNFHLPPLALQTVIENAVKHNIVSQEQPLAIHVSAASGMLTVRNTLQPRLNSEAPSGVGLKNLNARFHFLGCPSLMINQHGGEFTVSLPLCAS